MTIKYGEILVKQGIITAQQLDTAIREQKKSKELLGQVLVRLGFVSEKRLLEVFVEQQGAPFMDAGTEARILKNLAEQQRMQFVDLKEARIDDKAIKIVPAKFARHYRIMPMRIKGQKLTVAMSNPFDIKSIDDIERNLGYSIEQVIATSSDISEAIGRHYGVGADTIEGILTEKKQAQAVADASVREKVEDLEKMAEDASVVKLVNEILHRAINDRATDIHMENYADDIAIRFRIDGVLYRTNVSDKIRYLYPALVSRVKVMSGLDIVERRLPQDGRAKVSIGKSEYELRISVIPTLHGENIVIRILPTTLLFSISELGMAKGDEAVLQGLINRPHGVIFVVGPTGSGKTTTLYACLNRLNTSERKIVTIEDPVEYELKGASQIQVNPKIDLTFARALRSILRHDPDIMMVGEIRDFETAEIAIQAALTGHLVFSTLHTNDAAGSATRLLDIGIEPYLIASSADAFIAQRLARLVCPSCKKPQQMQESEYEQFMDLNLESAYKELVIYRGNGCRECNMTGYMGRTGIYEILQVSDHIRQLIMQKASSDAIKKAAVTSGMRTLRRDGWEKVLIGVTTPEEIIRVTQA